ncbi:MAG: TraB/GumN family protein [Zymomonas sp.]|nr:MAG: TraB/GumN family protein [Zymomonas sp.]
MTIAAALGFFATPASAIAQSTYDDAAQLDDIVVTARRAGAPMWSVTQNDATVILVGSISGVPDDFLWRKESLEAATLRSARILYPGEARASVRDVARGLWRRRTIRHLPPGTTSADYLEPHIQARLERLLQGENEDWRQESFVFLSIRLLRMAGYRQQGEGPYGVVRRAARQADIPGEAIAVFRGDDLVEGLISDSPIQHRACIEAAVAAAEDGARGATVRLEAWRALRVPEVLATPLERAIGLCWPAGEPEIAPALRARWSAATRVALSETGVTMGVAPLRVLAERGGVLDQLEATGFDVVGPDWRNVD